MIDLILNFILGASVIGGAVGFLTILAVGLYDDFCGY